MRTPPPEPTCEVTVADSTGKRWTMPVQARSKYYAVFAYNSQQVSGSYREYPKLTPETEIEVKGPDGRVHRTTYAKAMAWANRER